MKKRRWQDDPKKAKRYRADAARRGWVTRRANEAARAAAAAVRSIAARKGWDTRKQRALVVKVKPPGGGPVTPPKLPVYDVRRVERGAELGYARSLVEAEDVADDAAADDEEVARVERGPIWWKPRTAYLVTYRRREEEDVGEEADEWEIGFEYRGADRGSHVDVNIRIAREDGQAFGPREAAQVLQRFRDNLGRESRTAVPDGYLMAFIDWRRPRWGSSWQGGDDDVSHLVSFHAPMYTQSSDDRAWSILPSGDIRLGSIKK